MTRHRHDSFWTWTCSYIPFHVCLRSIRTNRASILAIIYQKTATWTIVIDFGETCRWHHRRPCVSGLSSGDLKVLAYPLKQSTQPQDLQQLQTASLLSLLNLNSSTTAPATDKSALPGKTFTVQVRLLLMFEHWEQLLRLARVGRRYGKF